jgi:hypothetical protein
VACTYLLDTEMRKMIFGKYAKAEHDRKQAVAIYRSIARGVGQFIHEADREVRDQVLYMLDAEKFNVDTSLSGPEETPQLWQGSFAISGQQGYGKNMLGFTLDNNLELADERQAIIEHLRVEEGLDVSLIYSNWEPHALYFDIRPELKLGSFAMLHGEPMPQSLLLLTPVAHRLVSSFVGQPMD